MKKSNQKETNSREQNRKYRTLVKNDRKKLVLAVAADNSTSTKSDLFKLLQTAQRNLDKAVSKKILHRNNAARKKSALFRILNTVK